MADLGQIHKTPLQVRVCFKSAESVSLPQIRGPRCVDGEGGMAWVAILFPLPLAVNSSSFALFFLITWDLGLFY
jgi:hypothetical protein